MIHSCAIIFSSGCANFTAGLRLCYCIIKHPIVDIIDYSGRTPTRIKLKKLKYGKQHFLILIKCVYFSSQYSSIKWIKRVIVCVHVHEKARKISKDERELKKVQ